MSGISETFVREYFEMHGFLVRQQRKFVGPGRRDEEEFDFYVQNPTAERGRDPLPFVLAPQDLARLERAVVVVKGWHTETFSPALLNHAPEIFRFVEPAAFQQAAKAFGNGRPPTKILVVPALPQVPEARQESIALLRAKGIEAVIPFSTILAEMIDGVETNRNYQKSDLLQVIRIFKNYDFFRPPQLELFRGRPGKPRRRSGD